MTEERLISFPATARSHAEPERLPRRRRDIPDAERQAPTRRTPRRRRQQTPWLQRNALSVAAASVLMAVLGLGFGLVQLMNRPEPSQALLAIPQTDTSGTTMTMASANTANPATTLASVSGAITADTPAVAGPRDIVAGSKVLDPNYTIVAGDTLGKIALRHQTSVERIQALNNLQDPRALRIGAKLVIPPPL